MRFRVIFAFWRKVRASLVGNSEECEQENEAHMYTQDKIIVMFVLIFHEATAIM